MPKCKACKQAFTPFNSMQKACGPKCALELVELQKKEKNKLFSSESVKKARKQLKKLSDSDRSVMTRRAQAAFNTYIRKRDEKEPCISCGRSPNDNNLTTGSRWDAGHYRSRGANPELKFVEINCWKQCVYCNRSLSGNVSNFRIGLTKKLTADELEWLEGPHEPKKYTIEELKEIEQEYKRKLKELN